MSIEAHHLFSHLRRGHVPLSLLVGHQILGLVLPWRKWVVVGLPSGYGTRFLVAILRSKSAMLVRGGGCKTMEQAFPLCDCGRGKVCGV